MSRKLAQQFIDALHVLERNGDVNGLVELFAEDCSIANVAAERVFRGRAGAQYFWHEYRGFFSEVESELRDVVAEGDRIAVQWVIRGVNLTGMPVTHDGASVMYIRGGKIKHLDAYFDAAVLEEQARMPPPY
ncbi:MAG: nuclear transport factor 2 family protein [Myxococcaceae bacterium]